ncbi:MAG TPA: hypothetical protein VFP65_11505 [Anaeromyxobacteraceae bacterium]|nr:hypothetical protein [Anaeromyxobacteraceae bacterium]
MPVMGIGEVWVVVNQCRVPVRMRVRLGDGASVSVLVVLVVDV